ncbi:uncharacterized protein LOC124634427 [Helicoverpa zea]|uniref:uncharacterized protein LOC124634427 n=1 Tax=Helicoverpa zea TaxID=7113 RepID=UPI001F5838E7|nr:uncharacterized protein LOC124634427 [Helicoverpa zea]
MLASLAESTLRQCNTCFRRWFAFCQDRNLNLFDVSVTHVLDFFVILFQEGQKYGSINSNKAALSLVLNAVIMNDPQVTRFMKGVYKLRTPQPRYTFTWDPAIVLDYLSAWYPNSDLSFERLSKKLTTLLALITAHRVQTLSLIKLSNIKKYNEKFVINITDQIKTSAVNRTPPTLILPYFDERPSICPARTLEHYLSVSATKRKSNCDSLLISFKKPFNNVTSQSLSRWIKVTLRESGIDTSIFCAHSTRHAATSAANRFGVSLDIIKRTAGWTGRSETFAKFYNREVIADTSDVFARSICRMASVNDV